MTEVINGVVYSRMSRGELKLLGETEVMKVQSHYCVSCQEVHSKEYLRGTRTSWEDNIMIRVIRDYVVIRCPRDPWGFKSL